MTQKLRLTRKRYEENHLEEDLPLVLSYQLQLAYLAEPSLIRDPVWGEFIKEIKSREFTPGASRFNEILAIEEVHTLSSALYENSKSFRGVMKGFEKAGLSREEQFDWIQRLIRRRNWLRIDDNFRPKSSKNPKYRGEGIVYFRNEDLQDTFNQIVDKSARKGISILQAASEILSNSAIEFASSLATQFSESEIAKVAALGPKETIESHFRFADHCRQVIASGSDVSGLDPILRSQFEKIARVSQDFFDEAFAGENQNLLRMDWVEYLGGRFRLGDMIRGLHYEHNGLGAWWMTPEDVAIITSKTSKSPVTEMYGEKATREIYWPKGSGDINPILNDVRIAVTKSPDASGKMQRRSLEMFAKDEKGNYVPYFFEWRGEKWVPSQTFRNKPVREACASCHLNALGSFSPRPAKIVKDAQKAEEIGYRRAFIEQFLKE